MTEVSVTRKIILNLYALTADPKEETRQIHSHSEKLTH